MSTGHGQPHPMNAMHTQVGFEHMQQTQISRKQEPSLKSFWTTKTKTQFGQQIRHTYPFNSNNYILFPKSRKPNSLYFVVFSTDNEKLKILTPM